MSIAALLGRAACGVTLHEEEFAFGGVLGGAVGELAGQTGAAEGGFALHHLARLAGGVTGLRSQHHLIYNLLRILRILFQIVGQHLAHHLVHDTRHLAVAQLGLGLSFELRFRHFHGDDGRKTFAEVVT